MPTPTSAKRPIVFVHGLWLHGESWNPWIEFFRAKGYEGIAAQWPGDGPTTADTRRAPQSLAGTGVDEIAADISRQLQRFSQPPILIGHSFGGLLVQRLLGANLASAAIAIDPAPIKGVYVLPLSALKAAFPALSNPFNYSKSVSLTEPQFRYAFTNAVPESEARALYEKYAMPAPARPLFQAATANLAPGAATSVDVSNSARGPLLLISGGSDHTVPPAIVKSTMKQYRGSSAVTELKEFAGRGHSLTIDNGWRELAEYCAGWLASKQL